MIPHVDAMMLPYSSNDEDVARAWFNDIRLMSVGYTRLHVLGIAYAYPLQ